jgi:chloramphenicol 3-O phosphotransferase
MPGRIIILNGTSSSGKTSIVRALQTIMEEPYLDAGLDRFLWMLPKRYLERPLWDDVLGLAVEAGDVGHRLVTGMHRAIRMLSTTGNNVVADHVLVERQWVQDCVALFWDLPAYLIGVHCPVEVLEQRERARRDRTLGQAKAQLAFVHRDLVYDLEVDTSQFSPEACARQIKVMTETGDGPRALIALRETLKLGPRLSSLEQ